MDGAPSSPRSAGSRSRKKRKTTPCTVETRLQDGTIPNQSSYCSVEQISAQGARNLATAARVGLRKTTTDNANGQCAEIAQELQFRASLYFVFCEFRLTRRAKQGHYAIMGFSKAVRVPRTARKPRHHGNASWQPTVTAICVSHLRGAVQVQSMGVTVIRALDQLRRCRRKDESHERHFLFTSTGCGSVPQSRWVLLLVGTVQRCSHQMCSAKPGREAVHPSAGSRRKRTLSFREPALH